MPASSPVSFSVRSRSSRPRKVTSNGKISSRAAVAAAWLPKFGRLLPAMTMRPGRRPFQSPIPLRSTAMLSCPEIALILDAAVLNAFGSSQSMSVIWIRDLPMQPSRPKRPASVWMEG